MSSALMLQLNIVQTAESAANLLGTLPRVQPVTAQACIVDHTEPWQCLSI